VLAVSLLLLWLTYGADFFTSVRTARLYSSHHAVLASESGFEMLRSAHRTVAPLVRGRAQSTRDIFWPPMLLARPPRSAQRPLERRRRRRPTPFLTCSSRKPGAALAIELLWSGEFRTAEGLQPNRACGSSWAPSPWWRWASCAAAYATTKLPRGTSQTSNKLDSLESRSLKYISEITESRAEASLLRDGRTLLLGEHAVHA